ncbi:hypothetical protein KO561_03415 [Radiobacillus kanasensis]|uniref:hypothetical protein n=1 Tax=Radiobacillus kanasensis TaxID=2844358 RepID=UPI001E2C21DC|nr:hypothetical protein [Radiobacillus kanasensis]UFU00027.1 hypothetical protein KO561_03415 [Radiobacillus kanasensis]
MVKRKVITTILATPISLMFIFAFFFGEWNRPFDLITMSGAFSLFLAPFILLYGVPVTFLSDYVCKQLTGIARTLTAFIVHLFFGVLFGFIAPMDEQFSLFGTEVNAASLSASITALFFWIIDELIRRKNPKSTYSS